MKKSIFLLPFLLLTGGCVWFQTDPAAEKAAAVYCRDKKVPPLVTLEMTLKRVAPSYHPDIRVEFARLAAAKGKNRNSPEQLLQYEESRLKLNAMLGFRPQDMISYVTVGVLEEELPELPPAEDVGKAALICRGGDMPAAELLGKVHLAYIRAVYACNMAESSPGPETARDRLISYVRLAEISGIPYSELTDLSGYLNRFERAAKRLKSGQK